MPIDPAGTAPGLTPEVAEPPVLNMRCKSDVCNSIQAIEMVITGSNSGTRHYQCCKCKRVWVVAVGGYVNL